ncbi:MAG: hypothetical protein MI919_24350 [Holophagales bacterium]|nr:hypothetical protein [Holophagales bacterium]
MDTELERPNWRATLSYSLHPRLSIGIEANPEADEIGPLLTFFLLTEDDRRPALFFGTSSDRIGSPEGEQAYFLTASKRHPWWPVSAYVSLNYSEWDEDFNFPFGVELDLGERFSMRPMYDGQRTHLTLSYNADRHHITLLWVWLERVGIAYSTRF